MLEDLATAIQDQDYAQAALLLEELTSDEQETPWGLFYKFRIAEGQGDYATARQGYRELIREINNPKLLARIRRGLERLSEIDRQQEQIKQAERQAAIASARNQPENQELGVFVLDRVENDQKQAAAQVLAEVFQIDAYSARLQLPSRGWRLYRTGNLGELKFYQQQLQAKGVPCFCLPVSQLLPIRVLSVHSLTAVMPQGEVQYRVNQEERATWTFDWSEVSQRVEGLIPIFSETVNLNPNGKVDWKTTIHDYARICDLHLPQHQTILRFCDQIYEFQTGINLLNPASTTSHHSPSATTHDYWQGLLNLWKTHIPQAILWNDFKTFAEPALDFPELLKLLDHQIDFMRRQETHWHEAFQLYSTLAFYQSPGQLPT